MKRPTIRLLLIEDEADHAQLIQVKLKRAAGSGVVVTHATSLGEGLQKLSRAPFDAILLDLSLPDSRGLDTIERAMAEAVDTPIVVLTSLDARELAIQAVQAGAQDYLTKTDLPGELLVRTVRYAIERQRSRRELQSRALELQRRNEELERFAAVAAHDLSAPSRGIIGLCRLLREETAGRVPAEVQHDIELLGEAAQRMSMLVHDLLTYARLGDIKEQLRSVDVGSAVAEAIENLQLVIQDSGAQIHVGPLPTFAACRTQMVQLFQNLVDNAIKYRGSAPPQIFISAIPQGANWLFRVQDNGRGIPTAWRDRVFDAFERGQPGEGPSGTGMGLAICRRIVERLGGRIWVEAGSSVGSILCFTVSQHPSPDAAAEPPGS